MENRLIGGVLEAEKVDLEPGMYSARLMGAKLYTDNKKLATVLNESDKLRVEDLDIQFPGIIQAALMAKRELEEERFVVVSFLHRRGRIQASSGADYMCMASNWISTSTRN